MYAVQKETSLNIDIDKLGKCYFDVKSKLGLKTDDKSLIDFNSICVNRMQMMKTQLLVVMLEVYIGLC